MRAVVVALILLLPAVSFASAGREQLPVVATESVFGSLWYSVRLPVGTTHMIIRATADEPPTGAEFVDLVRLFDENDTLIYGVNFLKSGVRGSIWAGSAILPELSVLMSDPFSPPYSTMIEYGCASCAPAKKELTILVASAGGSPANWVLTIEKHGEVPPFVLGGDAAYLHAGDFGGTVVGVGAMGSGVSFNAGATYSRTFERHAFGFFEPSSATTGDRMQAHNEVTACPCSFDDLTNLPGLYSFSLGNVGAGNQAGLFLADASLPPR